MPPPDRRPPPPPTAPTAPAIPTAETAAPTADAAPTTPEATVSAVSTAPPMNESSFKAMSAGVFNGGQLSLWAVDGEGKLWGQWKTSSDPAAGWSDWQKQEAPAPLQKVAVAKMADGRLEMWAIDRDGGALDPEAALHRRLLRLGALA